MSKHRKMKEESPPSRAGSTHAGSLETTSPLPPRAIDEPDDGLHARRQTGSRKPDGGEPATHVPTTGNDGAERLITRRLQVVGGSTIAVSLPKSWVETLRLHAGDEVMLSLRAEGNVWIMPGRRTADVVRPRVFDLRAQEPEDLLPLLTALYLASHAPIVLNFNGRGTPQMLEALHEACARLRGLQIVEETASQVTLLDLTDSKDLSLVRALRMMHLHVSLMLRHAESSLTKPGESVGGNELTRSENELDHLALLMTKRYKDLLQNLDFHPRGETTVEDGLAFVSVAQYLERVGDYAVRIAEAARVLDPVRREVLTAAGVPRDLAEAARLVDAAMAALDSHDVAGASVVIRKTREFDGTMERTTARIIGKEPTGDGPTRVLLSSAMFTVLESTERIGRYARSIGEEAMDCAVAARGSCGAPPTKAR